MEKKPKQVDFDRCVTIVEFDTKSDTIVCTKSHYKDDKGISVEVIPISLRTLPFQTAMGIACEFVRSVALVDYEEGK